MRTARDIMEPAPRSVPPETSVEVLARLLHEERLDGVCVTEDGQLVGVVTTMDLIYKEKTLHLPTFFFFLDAIIPLESPLRSMHELEKIAGDQVADIMSRDPKTVTPDTPIDRIASLMVEHHLSLVPVVDSGRLVGLVTKPGMLRAAFAL
jgi:CBS domain-containing protein